MKYLISEVARILGISSQAIRYYESKGVINPKKADVNNYRHFSRWDLDLLIRARILRAYGFEISETVKILNNEELKDLSELYSKQEEEIRKIISWNLNLLSRIQEDNKNIIDTNNNYGKFSIVNRPAMYRLENPNKDKTKIDMEMNKLTKKWVNMAPFITGSVRVSKEEISAKGNKYTFGQSIDEKYKEYFKIKENEYISYLPSVPCIYTIITFNSETEFHPSTIYPAMEYMKSQGLELKGDIITRVTVVYKSNEIYNCYHQVWLPI